MSTEQTQVPQVQATQPPITQAVVNDAHLTLVEAKKHGLVPQNLTFWQKWGNPLATIAAAAVGIGAGYGARVYLDSRANQSQQ